MELFCFHTIRSLVIPETYAMDMTRYLGGDFNFSAWSVALKHLHYGDKILRHFGWYANYQVNKLARCVQVVKP